MAGTIVATGQASNGGKRAAWAVSLALLGLWCAAAPRAGWLAAMSPVAMALADKGSDGGGSGSGGGDHSGKGGGDSDGGGDRSGNGGGEKSGKGDGDKSGNGGDDDKSGKGGDDKKGSEAEKSERRDVERFLDRLQQGGSVAFARVTDEGVEVRYSDGWSEAVAGGRYRLVDGRQRLVTERAARRSDLKRLSAAAATR